MNITLLMNKINLLYLKMFSSNSSYCQGSVVDYRVEIKTKNNIIVGQESILYKNITIYKALEGYFTMGTASHIAPFAYFLINKQRLDIGDNVAIGPFCSIFCSSNKISTTTLYKDSYDEADVKIGNNVFIGAQVVILPGAIIEDNVVVAANSVVKGKLESNSLYSGSPLLKVKDLI
ncbi:acyltransferase [Sulfurimonas sp.]